MLLYNTGQVLCYISKQKNPRYIEGLLLGGRPDSNRRPPEPQSGVLTMRNIK